MRDEELKQLWQSKDGPIVQLDTVYLAGELDDKLKKTDRTIRRRNNRETTTAYILMPVFATIAWFIPPILSKVGAAFVIPCCAVIIIMLKSVQRQRVQDVSLPTLGYLLKYKQYLQKEKRLLDTVAWWYIGPLILCYSLIIIGMHRYWLLVPSFIMAVLVYYINKRAAKNHFGKLIAKIELDISDLEGAGA